MKKVIVNEYPAMGGPKVALMGGDGYEAGPTNAGEYVLLYCGKHSSSRYAFFSKVRWGSEIEERGGKVYVKHDGKWRKLSALTGATRDHLLARHQELYGTAKIPKRWVFNDFGHVTCYFFKDRNGNRRLDGKERIHGEFFHTTPDNEAQTALGQPVVLQPSHGCIHIKPKDVDEMIKKKYVKRGNSIIIHSYDEKKPSGLTKDPNAVPPYEVHFYPGIHTIYVLGREKAGSHP